MTLDNRQELDDMKQYLYHIVLNAGNSYYNRDYFDACQVDAERNLKLLLSNGVIHIGEIFCYASDQQLPYKSLPADRHFGYGVSVFSFFDFIDSITDEHLRELLGELSREMDAYPIEIENQIKRQMPTIIEDLENPLLTLRYPYSSISDRKLESFLSDVQINLTALRQHYNYTPCPYSVVIVRKIRADDHWYIIDRRDDFVSHGLSNTRLLASAVEKDLDLITLREDTEFSIADDEIWVLPN